MPLKNREARRTYQRKYMRETWYPIHRELQISRVGKNRPTVQAKLRALRDKLKARPCADCGNVFPPECMDFDHVRGMKRAEVSVLGSRGAILAEAEKCDIVCANCHRTRTRLRRKNGQSTTKAA